MKSILLALALCACATGAHASDWWKALATDGESGMHFFLALPYASKEEAVAAALEKCSADDSDLCYKVVAVKMDQYLIGVFCSNGYDSSYLIGGSSTSIMQALDAILRSDDVAWYELSECSIAIESGAMPDPPLPESGE